MSIVLDFNIETYNQTLNCTPFSIIVLDLCTLNVNEREDCAFNTNTMIEIFENIINKYDNIYVLNMDKSNQIKNILPETNIKIIYNYINVPAVLYPQETLTETEINTFNFTTDFYLSKEPSYALDTTFINIMTLRKYLYNTNYILQ